MVLCLVIILPVCLVSELVSRDAFDRGLLGGSNLNFCCEPCNRIVFINESGRGLTSLYQKTKNKNYVILQFFLMKTQRLQKFQRSSARRQREQKKKKQRTILQLIYALFHWPNANFVIKIRLKATKPTRMDASECWLNPRHCNIFFVWKNHHHHHHHQCNHFRRLLLLSLYRLNRSRTTNMICRETEPYLELVRHGRRGETEASSIAGTRSHIMAPRGDSSGSGSRKATPLPDLTSLRRRRGLPPRGLSGGGTPLQWLS